MATHLSENLKLRLDTETLDALKELAADGDRTVAAEIRRALRAYVSQSPLRIYMEQASMEETT